jgi:ABC-type multidrug transport system permease subunit
MVLSSAIKAGIESFTGVADSKDRRAAYVDFLAYLLAYIVAMIILGFVGKLLWNGIIVDLFSVAKPAKSMWQIIGLMIFTSLMVPK